MALRSPTPFHSSWGSYPTVSLPTDANVQVGDTAFDTTLGQLVVCTSIGPVVWSPVATVSNTSLAFDASMAGAVPLLIGSVYLEAGVTIRTTSRAMIGSTTVGGAARLDLRRFTGGATLLTFSAAAGTLQDVLLGADVPVIDSDWYDLYLYEAASGNALAKGLRLNF